MTLAIRSISFAGFPPTTSFLLVCQPTTSKYCMRISDHRARFSKPARLIKWPWHCECLIFCHYMQHGGTLGPWPASVERKTAFGRSKACMILRRLVTNLCHSMLLLWRYMPFRRARLRDVSAIRQMCAALLRHLDADYLPSSSTLGLL